MTQSVELRAPAGFEQWRAESNSPASAALCLRYALAFNTLNFQWLDEVLSREVSYESQSVLDKLEGVSAVSDYLRGKILTLRRTRKTVRCELAMLPRRAALCGAIPGGRRP